MNLPMTIWNFNINKPYLFLEVYKNCYLVPLSNILAFLSFFSSFEKKITCKSHILY